MAKYLSPSLNRMVQRCTSEVLCYVMRTHSSSYNNAGYASYKIHASTYRSTSMLVKPLPPPSVLGDGDDDDVVVPVATELLLNQVHHRPTHPIF
jgi:hypothetical protein